VYVTDYTTIRVSKDAKEAAQESKHTTETWNEYIQRCTDNPPEIEGDGCNVDTAKLAQKLAELSGGSGPVELEATERNKIAEEVAGRLSR